MVRSRPLALAMLAGASLLALGACTATTTTAGPAVTVSVPGVIETTTPGGTTPSATAPGSTAPPPATPSANIVTVTGDTSFFITPSKNIGCAVTTSGARCDIGDRSWSTPPKPASCKLDYGNGLYVNASGAGVSCAGDTVLHVTTSVLPYGQGVRNGQMQCVSQSTGVRCEDVATGHGFVLAKESYTLF